MECKYELVISLSKLLDARDQAVIEQDNDRLFEIIHDILYLFPPKDVNKTASKTGFPPKPGTIGVVQPADIDRYCSDYYAGAEFHEYARQLYVHLYVRWRWRNTNKACDFETHVYTDNEREGIETVYRRLWCVFMGFGGSSRDEPALFNLFIPIFRATWQKRIAHRVKRQKAALEAATSTTSSSYSTEAPNSPHPDLRAPDSPAFPPSPPSPPPPTIDDLACAAEERAINEYEESLRRQQEDSERLSKAIVEMPSSTDRLKLWGITDQNVDAYSLDGGPKELIRWFPLERFRMRVAADKDGHILFARCGVHWCWERLHAWDEVVCFMTNRRVPNVSYPMDIVCPDCWIKLGNCLAYPGGIMPPGFEQGPLSKLQWILAGAKWEVASQD